MKLMLALVFVLPLVAALVCLALNRTVPTRWLGVGAAGALLVSSVALLAARLWPDLPLVLLDHTWTLLDDQPVRLALGLDAASWAFALLALAGGGLALLALAAVVPLNLRGFGGLFAALLLGLLATLLGLSNEDPLLLPAMWAMATIMSFLALRATGALAGSDAPLIVLMIGLLGVLTLLAATLALPDAAPAPPVALVCSALAGLLLLGTPPFHAGIQQSAEAPAGVAGVLLALGLPLLGGYTLIRFAAAQGTLPEGWRNGLTLLGLLALLVCAAGASSTTRMRQILGWQMSAQMGLLLLAIAHSGPGFGMVALALLANAALTTLAGYLAVVVLEGRAGTDDLVAIGAHGPLLLPGLAFLVGAASALGVPGTWGWWAHRWLFDGLAGTIPWVLPPLLAGTALLALGYVAPLAALWRAPAGPAARSARARRWTTLVGLACPALVALPLLILGVAPQLSWDGWLAAAQTELAPSTAPVMPALPGMGEALLSAIAAVLLVGLPVLALRGRSRCTVDDPEMQQDGVFAPHALGQSLRRLIWLAAPASLFQALWDGLLGLAQGARRVLALFEQRYYLAGLLLALVIVILLFI